MNRDYTYSFVDHGPLYYSRNATDETSDLTVETHTSRPGEKDVDKISYDWHTEHTWEVNGGGIDRDGKSDVIDYHNLDDPDYPLYYWGPAATPQKTKVDGGEVSPKWFTESTGATSDSSGPIFTEELFDRLGAPLWQVMSQQDYGDNYEYLDGHKFMPPDPGVIAQYNGKMSIIDIIIDGTHANIPANIDDPARITEIQHVMQTALNRAKLPIYVRLSVRTPLANGTLLPADQHQKNEIGNTGRFTWGHTVVFRNFPAAASTGVAKERAKERGHH